MNDILNRLLVVVMLIGINAFFVTAEFSIVAARRVKIRQLADQGNHAAKQVQYFHRHLDRLFSTTQIGITFSCLTLGWLGESMLSRVFYPLLTLFNIPFADSLSHALALPTAFLVIAYGQIVGGELIPKSLAYIYAESLACRLAPIMRVIARGLAPLSASVNHSTRSLLHIFGIEINRASWSHPVTPEELQFIIASEGDQLGLESFQRSLLRNLLAFGELTAADVMIPRTQLVVLNHASTYGELLEEIRQTGHTQFPVKGESLDDIQGMIDFTDLAQPLRSGRIHPKHPIKLWLKSPRFVPESMPLSEVLKKMQDTQRQLLMIVDEFGGTVGMVCWEDVMTLVLDATETEEAPAPMVLRHNVEAQQLDVKAQISLVELNNLLPSPLPTHEDYHTLSGFLLDQWQRIPKAGESYVYGEYCFTVLSATGPRLEVVRIDPQSPASPVLSPAIAV